MATREQIKKLFKNPRRVLQGDESIFEKQFDDPSLDETRRTFVVQNNKSWVSIVKSLVTKEVPYLQGPDGEKITLGDDANFQLSTVDLSDFLNNCNVTNCLNNNAEVFDVNRAFSAYYTILWQTLGRKAEVNPIGGPNILQYGEEIYEKGRGFWNDTDKLSAEFGSRWIKTKNWYYGTSSAEQLVYTGLIIPVHRAADDNNDDLFGCDNIATIDNESGIAKISGWRVNRRQDERSQYSGQIYTPTWLNYQMACTNPTKTRYGSPRYNVLVKDDFFAYNTSIVIQANKEVVVENNQEMAYATIEKASKVGYDSIYPNFSDVDGDVSEDITEYPFRQPGFSGQNVWHWQYYDDYLPYWNLVHPWRKVNGNEQPGIRWLATKNFVLNTSDYDHNNQSDGGGNKPFKDYTKSKNRVLNLRHGSLYGKGMPATDYKNPATAAQNINNFGFMKDGLFDGKQLNDGVLRVVGDVYGFGEYTLDGRSYDTDSVPFDLIIDFFKGHAISNASTDAVSKHKNPDGDPPGAYKELLRQNYFGFDREYKEGGWEGNRGGLAFALEPLKFVALNQKYKDAKKNTIWKYQTAFYFFSWAFKILNQSMSVGGCFLKSGDIPWSSAADSRWPMQEEENRKQHALYEFLLNFIYDLLYFAKVQVNKVVVDELPQPKDESVLIGKGDNFNDAAKSQIIENAQCYMLNTIDNFASQHTTFSKGFNLNYESILITQAKRGRGNPSYGGVKCDHFLNLLGKRDDVLSKLLNIKPAELALLQPRIRLYKQRKVINPKTGKEDLKPARVNVPGPFRTHIDSESIKSILAQRQGRMLGAGITEINIRSEGGNSAFDRNSLIQAEIKFHFNRLEEIFLNWPVYPKKLDGTVEYDKPDYPFGITPGYTKDNAPASIAELAFPPAMNPDDISLGKFTDYNKPNFQIMLEVGWSVPQTFESNINKNTVEAQFIEKMKEKTLYKTFFLSPQTADSEININENGTIEMTVGYIAIPDTLLESTKNKLFPSLHLDTFDADVNRQVTIKRNQIQKLRESEGKNTINSRAIQDKIDVLKKEIKKIIESAQDDKLANFLNKKISRFFGLMMGLKNGDHRGDTGVVPQQDPNRQIYHRISIPYSSLGIYKDLKKVRRWKPYRELGRLSNIKLGRKNVPNQGRVFDEKGLQTSSNVLKDAAQVANAAASNLENTRRALQNNDKNEAIKFKQLANKQFQNLGVDSVVVGQKGRSAVDIDFLYFGDIVQTVIDYAILDGKSVDFDLFAKPTGMREDFVNIIFGCLSIPLVGKDGNTRTVSIKITDIPIVANIFVDFTVSYLIKPEKYDISYLEFIVSFYRWFIKTYFSTKCFLGVREITSMHPEVNFFSMYGLDKKGKSIYFHPLTSFERSAGAESLKFKGLAYSPKQFADIMDDYDKKIRTGQYQKDASFHFCYLGGQTIGEGNYDYKDDLKKNIYHFYIGKDSGIVKNIQFVASELEGRAEAAWSVMGDGLNNAMFMIPRVYDVTVTLIGNHLFEPGQTFFVNPTMGTNLSIGKDNRLSSSDILKNTGLGGYYYIINMETRVKEGLFETVIEGVKIGLASSSATSQSIDSITAEDTTRASIDEMKEQMEKQKKRTGETRGPLDELKDFWRDL